MVDVTWRDVICACEAPVKKSKSSQRLSNAGSPDAMQSKMFVIHYVEKNQKTKKLSCKNIMLEATQGNAEWWIAQIEEKCKEGTYHVTLVL